MPLKLLASCYVARAVTILLDNTEPDAGLDPITSALGISEMPPPRTQVGRWIFDYTEVGEPHISTPASSYEYRGQNVSGWPDTPPLLTITCDADGDWVNLLTWRNIWPWGDSDVLVRHRLGAGAWTHDAWARWPQDILASASHWSTSQPIAVDAAAATARSLSVALYDRESWESDEQFARLTGLGHPAETTTVIARAEFSLTGIAEALDHLDSGQAPAP